MKQILITNTVHACDSWGNPGIKFEGGKTYPIDADTQRQVALGNGQEVDVEDPPAEAPAAEAIPDPAAEAPAPANTPKSKKA